MKASLRLSVLAVLCVSMLAGGIPQTARANVLVTTPAESQCARYASAYAPAYSVCTQALADAINLARASHGLGGLASVVWVGAGLPPSTLSSTFSLQLSRPWTAIQSAVSQWEANQSGILLDPDASTVAVKITLNAPGLNDYLLQATILENTCRVVVTSAAPPARAAVSPHLAAILQRLQQLSENRQRTALVC